MSGHKGPWVRPSGNVVRLELTYVHEMWREYDGGNGRHILTHDELPFDAVPLVPQSELDAANALLGAVASEISYTGDDEGLLQAVRNDRADCNRAGQSLAARHAADDVAKLQAELAEAKAELCDALRLTVEYVGNDLLPAVEGWSWFDALSKYQPDSAAAFVAHPVRLNAAPSLPAGDSKDTEGSLPQKLRAAAYLVDMQFDRLRSGDTSVAQILYDEADRLEREQAEKAEHEALVEQMAEAMYVEDARTRSWAAWRDTDFGNTYRSRASALLARFDITPKP